MSSRPVLVLALVLVLPGCGGGTLPGPEPSSTADEQDSALATQQAGSGAGSASGSAERTSQSTVPTADHGEGDLGAGAPMPEPGMVTRVEWLSWHWHGEGEPPPLPPVVRTMAMEDSLVAWAECLTESGFEAQVKDGIFESGYPQEQAQAYNEAEYLCKAQYPWDPKTYQPWNDEQLRVLYDYQTGDLAQCLAGLGYDQPAPPSFEKYVADYRGNVSPRWFPLDGVPLNRQGGAVEQTCPVQPADLYDLATVPDE